MTYGSDSGQRLLTVLPPSCLHYCCATFWRLLLLLLLDAGCCTPPSLQDCAARGLVVDIAKELPVSERKCSDSRGRELNLAWSLPWTGVHVQMPWLSCQRSKPEEAAVLQAAKAVWGRRAAAAAAGPGRLLAASAQRSQWQRSAGDGGVTPGGSSRVGGVVAAMAAAAGGGEDMQLPLLHPPPPPPPPAKLAAATSNSSSTAFAAPLLPAQAGSSSSTNSSAVEYQDGPLMLFVDTSAFLAMLGCPGSVTSSTNLTLKLLQALAGSGRFGRGKSLLCGLERKVHCILL